MISCLVDFQVDDTPESLRAFLVRLKPVLDHKGSGSWAIDCSSCTYLGPNAAAVLGALWLQARNECAASIVLPREPPKLDAFCAFSGLKHLVLGEPPPDPSHPDCETVPITQFSMARWNEPDSIVHLIRRHMDLEKGFEDYLRTALNEVVQNIEDHAESPIGGVWCARYLSGKREVRVAVVDLGKGIAASLASRFDEAKVPYRALQMVFEGNYSSKSRKNNLGVGISNLAFIVRELKGELFILSDDGLAVLTRKRKTPTFETTAVRFPGTAVFFSLRVPAGKVSDV
jgi:hypothetical protein